ncbi:hypothetical protein Dda_7804 [Drechslerella dactyloides]|uniref:Uncharacterized protein n=1 Tax=Drechslerella dactyloides TaxID=74499 RepID=A0AAD6IUF3_DREDA|nr:hypothetical protein Dda_7804 [Drechslerella dactyloides]
MPAVPSTPQANSPKDRDPPRGGDRELEDGIYYIVNNAGRDAGQAEVYISRPRSRDTPGGDGTMQVQVLGSMADSDKWRVTKSKSRNGETVYLLENKYDTVSERYGKLVGIPRDNNGGSGGSPWRETRWKITRSRDRWGNEQKWTIEKASWRSDDVSLGWSVTMTGPRGVVFHNYQVNCVELEKVPREIIDSTNFMFRPA